MRLIEILWSIRRNLDLDLICLILLSVFNQANQINKVKIKVQTKAQLNT
jgi:hypothetical protein